MNLKEVKEIFNLHLLLLLLASPCQCPLALPMLSSWHPLRAKEVVDPLFPDFGIIRTAFKHKAAVSYHTQH